MFERQLDASLWAIHQEDHSHNRSVRRVPVGLGISQFVELCFVLSRWLFFPEFTEY